MGILASLNRFRLILVLPNRRPISYQYSPLPSSPSLRLLKFKSGAGNDISFSIAIFSLKDAPKFDALSYTWGQPLPPFSTVDGVSASRTSSLHESTETSTNSSESGGASSRYDHHFPVICNDQEIIVQANLFDALLMLRNASTRAIDLSQSQYFWIDALCINQNDTAERSNQVAIMSKIYKSAEQVVAWLGPGDGHTADALAAIHSLSTVQEPFYDLVKYADFSQDEAVFVKLGITPLNVTHFLALIAFFSRPWFKRAWVVQEVAFAKKITVVCGDRIVAWELISRTLSFLKETGWQSKLNTASLKHLSASETIDSRYDKLFESNAQLDPAVLYLDRTRQDLERKRVVQWRGAVRTRLPSLRLLLETHRHTLTTDPRDKVYSFLGLAGKRLKPWSTHPKCINPDYDISASTLYIQTARALMLSYRSLSLLSHVQDSSRTMLSNLPSWCPDWSAEILPYPLRFRGDCNWCANATMEWIPVENDGRVLVVQGKQIDTIKETSITPDESKTQGEYWSDVAKFAAPLHKLYPVTPVSGKCLSGLNFLVTGVMLKTGRNDMESLIKEFGGTLSRDVRSAVDWVVVGTRAGPGKLAEAARLGIPCIDEDGLKNMLAQHLTQHLELASSYKPLSRWETLWRTMIADTFAKKHPALSSCGATFRQLLDDEIGPELTSTACDAPQTATPTANTSTFPELNQLRSELEATSTRRRLFCTSSRQLLGPGPLSSRPGDEVWVLGSGQVPYVLRRESSGHRHRLVGESYVHGIMHGEAMEMVDGFEDVCLE